MYVTYLVISTHIIRKNKRKNILLRARNESASRALALESPSAAV